MDWPKLLLMDWPNTPWLQNESDIELAGEEIRTRMGRSEPSNDEVCSVIRWMAGPEGKQNKPPSLRELIRAVYIRRKQDREADGPPVASCAMCLDGWALTPGNAYKGHTYAIPCLCQAGRRLTNTVKEYKGMTEGQRREMDGRKRVMRNGNPPPMSETEGERN